MQIRDWTDHDLEQIWMINQAEVPEVSSVTEAELGAIARQSEIALVAQEGDTIGGFCLVLGPDADYTSQNYAWFCERYERMVYLDRVAIAPQFQRRGWGQQLYAEVERRAVALTPKRDVWTLEVNLVPRNNQSLAFHAKLGFTQVGVRTPTPDHSLSMMARPL